MVCFTSFSQAGKLSKDEMELQEIFKKKNIEHEEFKKLKGFKGDDKYSINDDIPKKSLPKKGENK
jgi:hypothetical protein